MPQDEVWSWKKAALGVFTGKNWLKAAIFGLIFLIEVAICASVYTVIKTRFAKPVPVQTEQYQAQTITKVDSHDQTEKKGLRLGLIQIG